MDDCLCYDNKTGAFCEGFADACVEYGRSVAWNALYPTTAATACLVLLWVFSCSRRCCGCCGSMQPSSDVCGNSSTAVFRGYTRRSVWCWKGMMLLVLACGVAVGTPSLVENERISQGVASLHRTLGDLEGSVDGLEEDVSVWLRLLQHDIAPADADAVRSAVKKARAHVADVDDLAGNMAGRDHTDPVSRKRFVLACVALVFGTLVLVALLALYSGHGAVASAVYVLTSFVCVFMLFLAVVHFVLSEVFTEFCSDYPVKTQPLRSFFENGWCGADEGRPWLLLNRSRAAFGARLCGKPAADVCQALPCDPCTAGDGFAGVLGAANACINDPSCGHRNASMSFIEQALAHNDVSTSLDVEGASILSCLPVSTFFQGADDAVCSNISPGIRVLFLTFSSLTVILLVSLYLITMGSKRFILPPIKLSSTAPENA